MEKTAVVVGGRLQGTEALYLAKKAGMKTTLIDKNPCPIGQNFCNRFICEDVIQYSKDLLDIFTGADFVIPSLENEEVLAVLDQLREEFGFTLIYDPGAYQISSSKLLSDQKMVAAGVPVPLHYPQGKPPYIVKPSSMSGSEGVAKVDTREAAAALLAQDSDLLAEEYLSGSSYSIEMIGTPGNYRVFHITELFMDQVYDCKRVLSCPDFPRALKGQFEQLAVTLGELVQLHGIMDVEVIENNGILKVLEIDARIPSQTPSAVYHATGVNFMEEIYQTFVKHPVPRSEEKLVKERYSSYEQILVKEEGIFVLGEHILCEAAGLRHEYGFCGADESFTDYAKGKSSFIAVMICVADSREALAEKRKTMFHNVGRLYGKALQVFDLEPTI